ncbi:MAG: TonB family protein [Opitutaceae bacterium]
MSENQRTPAFMLSLALHGALVALVLLLSYAVNQQVKNAPKVFELVAGAGDNYMATEAPALGLPTGVKIDLPTTPTPQIEAAPEPIAPAPVAAPEPSTITPAPIEKAPPEKAPLEKSKPEKALAKPTEPTVPNFKNQITKKVNRAEAKAKQEIKKEREAEAKMTKEAFDKANKAKSAAKTKAGSSKIEPVGQGIREGVIGGSPKNTKGGAGGKALTAEDGTLMERYFSLLKARLKENHEKPSGLSDALMARVEFYVGADGSISRVRISKSSGSEEFDRSVREAFARTKSIGSRPDKKGETVELEFRMREEDGD